MVATSFSEPAYDIRSISIDEARAAATGFLLDHVGNQLVAGQPQPMISAVKAVWIVPVLLTYIHVGVLGEVGVVAVDDETGQVIAWTPITQMKAASRRLRTEHEPQVTEHFHAYVGFSNGEMEQ